MAATTSAARVRNDLHSRLLNARARTDEVFAIVREDAMYERPVPERHRIIFYLGHVEAFDWNLLSDRVLGLRSFHKTFDELFAFGIDPVGVGLPTDAPTDWPQRTEIDQYRMRLRQQLDAAIAATLAGTRDAEPSLTTMLNVAIEHRLMHAETLTYLLHRLPASQKIGKMNAPESQEPKGKSPLVEIPAGDATLGLRRVNGDEFGWDNEFESQAVEVADFAIGKFNVTNSDFLKFLQAGGYENPGLWTDSDWNWKQRENLRHPAFWKQDGSIWMYRTMFGDVPLPADWPVYVSHAEASAYARWMGRRLPTEAQFHRAAYGTPAGEERTYPWGEEAPTERHGNFDFRRWDPAPAGSHPQGASAFGLHDLLGNGWEWTRTPFEPFPGFAPMSFYPGYSANFFDGDHYVMKGGSPRTAACMLRRSFRNWFQPHYPYVYATFRCVED
ncbi:MAG: SUMF1/EgtB/PvdO family nonheme iron enzyme [Candidatus Acidiferrum sp.]|jgi:iron(II)-dependent oxidoreductase